MTTKAERTRRRILDATAHALATRGYGATSVKSIADAVGMQDAAFYYHFASKDEILDEIVAGFAEHWTETVQTALAEVTSRDDLATCIDAVLTWVEDHERAARVYFVTSIGATSSCETVRRRTRNELARRAARTFRELSPAEDKIRVAIAGLGFVTLLEIVSRSRLDLDASYRTLGPVRFRATAGQLAEALIH